MLVLLLIGLSITTSGLTLPVSFSFSLLKADSVFGCSILVLTILSLLSFNSIVISLLDDFDTVTCSSELQLSFSAIAS